MIVKYRGSKDLKDFVAQHYFAENMLLIDLDFAAKLPEI